MTAFRQWTERKYIEENIDAYYMVCGGPLPCDLGTKEFVDIAKSIYDSGLRIYS